MVSVRFLTVDLCVNCAVISSCQQNVKESKLVVTSSSFVNFIFSVVLFIVCKMSSVLSFLTVARTSSTYLFHVLISLLLVTDLFSRSCMTSRTVKHRALIENIQRRATKFILNYPKNMSYQERLIKTNLLPLEFRREILDLQLFYKSKNRLIPMDVNNYLRTYDPGYTSRHYDENNFYFITKHKQDYFRNSFFVRSANLWNSLSSQLKSCTSISVFSSRLRKMYEERLLFYSPPGCS